MKPALLPLRTTMHGGPDALGAVKFDFSTNSNACGPCPLALQAVLAADPAHYPDPTYTKLRAQLAQWHGVQPVRVLLAASASEFIFRMTAWAARNRYTHAVLPKHSYGDYASAANAMGLCPALQPSANSLAWACDPSSPLGRADACLCTLVTHAGAVVLDRAYEPLRLQGVARITAQELNLVWQLWTPNKALGLTGVRAAYAIAPLHAANEVRLQIESLCPSWPLGAHGVAMLTAWVQPQVQQWLANSLHTLREWKVRQLRLCTAMGWTCLPSEANFFCIKPNQAMPVEALRAHGIKLRDCTSFGLPHHARLSVQPPEAQDALARAMKDLA